MGIDRFVFAFAGTVIIASVLLGMFHSIYWLYLTLFVGANLFQSAFTRFCPLASILKVFGMKPGCAFE